jgi:hypothetical protein
LQTQALQQQISDNAGCEHFANVKDTVVFEGRRIEDLVDAGTRDNLKEFCGLGKEVSGVGNNVVNNINRTASDLQAVAERNGISTRLAVTDSTSNLKDNITTGNQWVRDNVSSIGSNLKDTIVMSSQTLNDTEFKKEAKEDFKNKNKEDKEKIKKKILRIKIRRIKKRLKRR